MSYNKFSSRDYVLFRKSPTELPPASPDSPDSPDSPKTAATDDNKTKVKKKSLINKLNYIHFIDGTIHIKLKHKKYDNEITLEAKPQPCLEHTLECLWVPTSGLAQKLQSYAFHHILLSDGLKHIQFEAEVLKVDEQGLSIDLPEFCYEQSSRKIRRHVCKGIDVELIQNGAVFYGNLIEFSSLAFKVSFKIFPPHNFHWIRSESIVNLRIKDKDNDVYFGACEIVRASCDELKKYYILKPVEKTIRRYKSKEFRSPRQILNPSPTIHFIHPIIKRTMSLPIYDIAGSGFSIEEYIENSALISGMIIYDLKIEFTNDCSFRCDAQIVSNNIVSNNSSLFVRSGLAILDINNVDQVKIFNVLHQANRKESFVSNRLDLDKLWEFFFESGFIYPQKYNLIHTYSDKIKETYKKLYDSPSNIFRHFVYQDRGQIKAHMSMIWFYRRSWLIHHHASSKISLRNGGISVLQQIGRLGNESHQLYNNNMDFLICYFRPENRFPKRVFGGFAEYINNPKACSVDSFAYFHLSKHKVYDNNLLPNLDISISTFEDLLELECCYENFSGGLLVEALGLKYNHLDITQVSEEFHKKGLKRERLVFSLRDQGTLIAIIMVNLSDICLNMSDLTNCVKIIIVDDNKFKLNYINYISKNVSKYFEQKQIPFLLFPKSYLDNKSIQFKKVYNLWIINLHYTDNYFSYMEKFSLSSKHNIDGK